MCVNNMLGLAPSLGCSSTDAKCLCGNVKFANGLKDCSLEACGAAVQSSVVAFGVSYCSCMCSWTVFTAMLQLANGSLQLLVFLLEALAVLQVLLLRSLQPPLLPQV